MSTETQGNAVDHQDAALDVIASVVAKRAWPWPGTCGSGVCGSWSWTPAHTLGTHGARGGIRAGCSPPAQYDAPPDMDFPAPAATYPDKDQVADYLEAYARCRRPAGPAEQPGHRAAPGRGALPGPYR